METKKERTLADIQREYSEICGKLGHAEVQLTTLRAEIPRLHESAQTLILESASLQAKLATAPKVETEKQEPTA